jgi:2,3-dihydroxy-p-cumate/2,3-dihydroxybenzoate 3,4-dioxygenase
MEQAAEPFVATVSKIERLGHVVVGAADPAATISFFTEHLNFRVSDSVGEMVTFMRCFPNPLHHSFAIGAASENRLHHVNFMVTDMDDIGSGNNRLKRAGVPIVYGPGRHPPSGSVFLYFLDPDGMTFEYSYGMEEFPELDPRQSRRLEPSFESFDFWGGDAPDARFAKVGRITPVSGKRPTETALPQASQDKVS